jgi:hypothetical protein
MADQINCRSSAYALSQYATTWYHGQFPKLAEENYAWAEGPVPKEGRPFTQNLARERYNARPLDGDNPIWVYFSNRAEEGEARPTVTYLSVKIVEVSQNLSQISCYLGKDEVIADKIWHSFIESLKTLDLVDGFDGNKEGLELPAAPVSKELDEWFHYREEMKIKGANILLKTIAQATGYSEGHVKNKHAEWRVGPSV